MNLQGFIIHINTYGWPYSYVHYRDCLSGLLKVQLVFWHPGHKDDDRAVEA